MIHLFHPKDSRFCTKEALIKNYIIDKNYSRNMQKILRWGSNKTIGTEGIQLLIIDIMIVLIYDRGS
jgi:hypothetical protein